MLVEHLPYLVLAVLAFNAKTFSEKMGVLKASPIDVVLMRYIFSGIFCIAVILYLGNSEKLLEYTKDTKQMKYIVIMSISSILSVIGYYNLLKYYDASYVIAISTPLFILVAMLIDTFYFNKECSYMRVLGILVVSLGLYIVYLSEKKK